MCLAHGPQRSDAGEARACGPSVLNQALYHWATALPDWFYDIITEFLENIIYLTQLIGRILRYIESKTLQFRVLPPIFDIYQWNYIKTVIKPNVKKKKKRMDQFYQTFNGLISIGSDSVYWVLLLQTTFNS